MPLTLRLAGLAALVSCSDNNGTGTNQTPVDLRLQEVVSGLSAPLHLTSPPEDDRLFVWFPSPHVRAKSANDVMAVSSRARSNNSAPCSANMRTMSRSGIDKLLRVELLVASDAGTAGLRGSGQIIVERLAVIGAERHVDDVGAIFGVAVAIGVDGPLDRLHQRDAAA